MTLSKLLVANRGEIAIRIVRAAADMGISTVSIYSTDDAKALHVHKADHAVPLTGRGVAPYLAIQQIVNVAKSAGCDSVHPGYGFLAENADFARACATAGLTFVGPRVETLALFGNKVRATDNRAGNKWSVRPGSRGVQLEVWGRVVCGPLGGPRPPPCAFLAAPEYGRAPADMHPRLARVTSSNVTRCGRDFGRLGRRSRLRVCPQRGCRAAARLWASNAPVCAPRKTRVGLRMRR